MPLRIEQWGSAPSTIIVYCGSLRSAADADVAAQIGADTEKVRLLLVQKKTSRAELHSLGHLLPGFAVILAAKDLGRKWDDGKYASYYPRPISHLGKHASLGGTQHDDGCLGVRGFAFRSRWAQTAERFAPHFHLRESDDQITSTCNLLRRAR